MFRKKIYAYVFAGMMALTSVGYTAVDTYAYDMVKEISDDEAINTKAVDSEAQNTEIVNIEAIESEAINTEAIDTDEVNTEAINSENTNTGDIATEGMAAEGIAAEEISIPEYPEDFGIYLPPDKTNDEDADGQISEADELTPDTEGDGNTANITHYKIKLGSGISSSRDPVNAFYASTPKLVTFLYMNKYIGVAYPSSGKATVQLFDAAGKLNDTVSLDFPFKDFGTITSDEEGNYYVTSGKEDSNNGNSETMCISKYDKTGHLITEQRFRGYETAPYGDDSWGTKIPFDAGNCAMAVNDGILAVNYAREMYNGHQSNMMIYLNCEDLKRVYADTAYTSHSFDQRIYPSGSSGFIVLNQGDAYYRGFHITKVSEFFDDPQNWFTPEDSFYTFHFREGANRSYGYNETFAQLGGFAEMKEGCVFAGSSERTLSIAPAPSSGYLGHNEARDLFVQILRPDFPAHNAIEDKYLVPGQIRGVTGSRDPNSKTEQYLAGDEIDYGIIWLTEYDSSHYAANPKVFALSDSLFGVLWEKRSYGGSSAEVWFTLMDTQGRIVRPAVRVPGCRLASDTDPVVFGGNVWWASSDGNGANLQCMSTSEINIIRQPYIAAHSLNDDKSFNMTLKIEATGVNRYCWQMSTDLNTWSDTIENLVSGSSDKDTLIVCSTDDKIYYRCVMTDTIDNSVASAAVSVCSNDPSYMVEAPLANIPSGEVEAGCNILLSTGTVDAKIYYTTDGSEPSVSDALMPLGSTIEYTDAITINTSVTIRAIAVKSGYKASVEAVYEYTITEDWGEIEGDNLRNVFASAEAVPNGVWYIFGNETDGYTPYYLSSAKTPYKREATGDKITFSNDVKVFYSKTRLWENRDYTLAYKNNQKPAGASDAKAPLITVKGKGYYGKSAAFSFSIIKGEDVPASKDAIRASKVKVACLGNTVEFTGEPFALASLYKADKTGYKDITLYTVINKETKVLSEGIDYDVDIANNGSCGKHTVVFKLKGNYTGTIKKTVNVKPYDLSKNASGAIKVTCDDTVYKKAGAVPKVTVKCGEAVLKEGIDYKLSCKNNNKVADKSAKKSPVVTVAGIGNYKGKITQAFTVTAADINDLTMSVDDKVFKSGAGASSYKSSVKIMDGDKAVALGDGKDIVIRDLSYYNADTKEELIDGVPVNENSTIEVHALIAAGKTGLYKGDAKELVGTYRVISANRDLSKAKASVKNLSYKNGSEIVPLKSGDISVILNGRALTASEYEVMSVTNNRFPGKATVKIRGTGGMGGTKTITFKIVTKVLE